VNRFVQYIREICVGAWSLAVGMGITFAHLFKRRVTVNYPYETLPMTPRFRGHIELIPDEATRQPKCVACMACMKACPSNCIVLEGHKPEGATKRVVTSYTLNFTTCSLCGLCVESCNFDALQFSKDYNLASPNRKDYEMDLLAPFRKRGGA
jgi:NADH-quinone oxidoreductase subunit I